MATHSLNKTIEARKLSRTSGLPLPGQEISIPYGAIIENPHRDGNMWRFTHCQELYRCANDVLRSALDAGALDAVAAPETSVATVAVERQASGPLLGWETVASSQFSVWRSRVPGGWLVAVGAGPSVAFYPDPEHRWDGGSAE